MKKIDPLNNVEEVKQSLKMLPEAKTSIEVFAMATANAFVKSGEKINEIIKVLNEIQPYIEWLEVYGNKPMAKVADPGDPSNYIDPIDTYLEKTGNFVTREGSTLTGDISRLIPKDKIKGMRFGQIIYNAIMKGFVDATHDGASNAALADILFDIENDGLESLVKSYLKELK